MDLKNNVTFDINGIHCSVGSDVDSDVSLNDYLRNRLNLRGTKYMCKEGGCGSCIVNVTAPDTHTGLPRTFSVNSCLVSITSCQDWSIKTVEGIGNRLKGYHPVQRALAEHNGTQCGYCSPGWVMSMYSLLESNNYNLTEHEIENSFGSNTCRCTGYRPILEAFKTFAKDAPKPKEVDIEDLAHICLNKGSNCEKTCANKEWCVVKGENVPIKIELADKRIFYRVHSVSDIFQVLNAEGYDSYMLVNGNTGRGAYPIFAFPRVLIDISAINELKEHSIDQNLIVGAGNNLNNVMALFKAISEKYDEFSYLKILYEHLDLVAHIPVRNIASVAGNLMVKYFHNEFSSDPFLLFEAVGAILTILDKNGKVIEVTPEEFLKVDMHGKVIVNVKLPPLSKNYHLVTFKIMPRHQNAHAHVNAAFLYKIDKHDNETVQSATIVFGGLSSKFVHARKTEAFVEGKKIYDVFQQALKILDKELIVEEIEAEPSPAFRKKLALGLFYKGLLSICKLKLSPQYRSGVIDMKKVRPVSKGKQAFDTNPSIWPINEPTPKVEALIQCAGEAPYVNDIVTQPQEVFAAFVTTKVSSGQIESIDATKALSLDGVLAFYSAKDIPGINEFPSIKLQTVFEPEEVFVSDTVKHYDQPLGIIVAKTEKLANRAVHLVEVKYKNVKPTPPVLRISDAKTMPDRVTLAYAIPATDRGANVERVIKGNRDIKGQYHYTMETQSCITKPADDGIDVYSSTQWLDAAHISVAEALKIDVNSINIELRRVGGAYGCKISRSHQIAVACALATHLLNKPCRFVMSIESNMRAIGKRPPASGDFEVGVSNTGEIQYLVYNIYEDNGYIFSDQTIFTGLPGIKNCYDRRRWTFKAFNITTDTASNTWCRSPGNFETIALTEYIMEQISWATNRDPVDVRLANLSLQDPSVLDVINNAIKDSEYRKRREEVNEFNKLNRWKKRGLRVAFMSWPVSTVSYYNVLLYVYYADGTVVIKHGGVEMGQGVNTKVRQVCAYTLKIPLEKIRIKGMDAVSNPSSFTSGGSQASEAVCFATIKACQLLLDRLEPVREIIGVEATWEVLINEAYRRGINLQTSYIVTPNDQTPYRVTGATVSEVELDVLTGEHEIRRVDIHEDAGLSTNPEIDVGQIEGAFIMGVGIWTSEDLIYNKKSGELETNRSWNYYVPLAKDIPVDFRISLTRNSFNPMGILGSKASGEPATCMAVSVAFALREAIAASREDTGYPKGNWFNIDGQFSVENMVLAADVRLDEFKFI